MAGDRRGDRRVDTDGTAVYEIRIRSELGDAWSDWFTALRRLSRADGDTVLVGPLDQAALHAVLRRIRDLGLPLISVLRVEAADVFPDGSHDAPEDQP